MDIYHISEENSSEGRVGAPDGYAVFAWIRAISG